jgi:endo-1,4-beta-xylanase
VTRGRAPGLPRSAVRRLTVALAVALAAAGLLVSCTGDDPGAAASATSGTTARPTSSSTTVPCGDDCPLRVLADRRGLRIGTAVSGKDLCGDLRSAGAAAVQFNSVTAENDLKWSEIRPTPERWDWADADVVVDFAEEHDMEVRGHTLAWGQAVGNGLPAWMRELTDPEAFRDAVTETITTEVRRYRGRVDRWDVVNEPLLTAGTELDPNPFLERLGPGYLDLAFRTARAADPDAELWLNENFTEYLPAKADALVELVRTLRAGGTPIDGVGLQTHLIVDAPVRPGAVGDLVRRLRGLGVAVALTELDVPTGPTRDATAQAGLYRQVVGEAVGAGAEEVTVWGINDGTTWLDDPAARAGIPTLAAFPAPTRPLLLDIDNRPTSAHAAVAAVLAGAADGGTGS